jgi:hypothetical protein
LHSLEELPNADELKRVQLTENPVPEPTAPTPESQNEPQQETTEEEG